MKKIVKYLQLFSCDDSFKKIPINLNVDRKDSAWPTRAGRLDIAPTTTLRVTRYTVYKSTQLDICYLSFTVETKWYCRKNNVRWFHILASIRFKEGTLRLVKDINFTRTFAPMLKPISRDRNFKRPFSSSPTVNSLFRISNPF